MAELSGKRIAFLVAQEGVEEVELTKPWEAVEEAGGAPVLIAPESGEVQAFNHLDKGSKFSVDETLGRRATGRIRRSGAARRRRQPRSAAHGAGGGALPAGVLRRRQARRRDLSRAVDARRGRSGARPQADLVAVAADRHPQRRRGVGRRGGRDRRGPRLQPQARRSAGLLREDRRGVRRGRPRGGERRGDGGRTRARRPATAQRSNLLCRR